MSEKATYTVRYDASGIWEVVDDRTGDIVFYSTIKEVVEDWLDQQENK